METKCLKGGICPIKKAGVQSAELIKKNSPIILTGIAVVGLVGTAVLAVRVTPKAVRIIEQNRSTLPDEEELTKVAMVKLTWRLYLPAIMLGGVTIASMVGSHKIQRTRNIALAGLYSVTENTLKEYQSKVIETIGDKKERKVRDEIRQERVDKTYSEDIDVLKTIHGDVLIYDMLSGRYFRGDVETIRKAENDINSQLFQEMYASLNEFYSRIGLPNIGLGNEVGWRVEEMMKLDLESATITKGGEPCIVLDYDVMPDARFQR